MKTPPVSKLLLAMWAKVNCSTQVCFFLDGCTADCAGLTVGALVHEGGVPTRRIVDIELCVATPLVDRQLQGGADGLVEGSLLSLVKSEYLPTGVEPGAEQDILQVTIAHTPHAGLAD